MPLISSLGRSVGSKTGSRFWPKLSEGLGVTQPGAAETFLAVGLAASKTTIKTLVIGHEGHPNGLGYSS
jgi:hypothetical protein